MALRAQGSSWKDWHPASSPLPHLGSAGAVHTQEHKRPGCPHPHRLLTPWHHWGSFHGTEGLLLPHFLDSRESPVGWIHIIRSSDLATVPAGSVVDGTALQPGARKQTPPAVRRLWTQLLSQLLTSPAVVSPSTSDRLVGFSNKSWIL